MSGRETKPADWDAGRIPGYPASHGCVRVPEANAQWLYRFVSVGMLEHVGCANYRDLGELIKRCLKPEGLALILQDGGELVKSREYPDPDYQAPPPQRSAGLC